MRLKSYLLMVALALLALAPVHRVQASDRAAQLIKLAQQEFGTLTEAEAKFFDAVANGSLVDYSAEAEEENDPGMAEKWGEERILRASRVAWLCTDPEAARRVTHRGIEVMGVRVDGELYLQFAKIPFPLRFEGSAFLEGIDLRDGEVRALNLRATHTGPLDLTGLKVERDVFLRDGFRAEGGVSLLGATIGGNLVCDRGQFIHKNTRALNADGLNVRGDVYLRREFKAEGEVRLVGATIGGDLDCRGGQFINKRATALNADGLNVKGTVFLTHEFKAEGEVRLVGATIGGNLVCDRGHFINKRVEVIALNAASLNVKGHVFLSHDFKAEGEVCLVAATIGGSLDCRRGQFSKRGGNALNAEVMNVRGSVLLSDGFKAEGDIYFAGATIDGYFVMRYVASLTETTLDLRSASIGTLRDDQWSWPEPGKLLLHGLTYDQIDDDSPKDAETRLDWLRRQPPERFQPQPYEQLAAELRRSGRNEDAKRILIAKAKDPARLTQLTFFERWWHWSLGVLVGHGYRPWRALWFVLGVVALGWAVFAAGFRAEVITPTKEGAYVSAAGDEDRQLSKDYPNPNALMYSLDVFVPVVDLHQASYWLPNAARDGELRITEQRSLGISGRALRCYFWFHIVAGWILTTLLVVALTGVIRG